MSRPKILPCTVAGCQKAYSCNAKLKQHMLSHSGQKPFSCDQCGMSYYRKDHLQRHINRFHLDIREFQCDLCHMQFKAQQHLKAHLKSHQSKFQCAVDGEMFRNKQLLLDHSREVHQAQHAYVCSQCDLSFEYPSQLKSHKIVHRDVQVRVCFKCDAVSSDKHKCY